MYLSGEIKVKQEDIDDRLGKETKLHQALKQQERKNAAEHQEKMLNTLNAAQKLSENQKKYNYKEAYCLMQYQCDTCGHRELAWNSRDGVTPFGVGCPSCGETLSHTNFHADIPSPDHKPYSGQLVFRDGTIEESVAIVKARFDHFDETEYKISEDRKKEWLQELRSGTNDEFKPGWPMPTRHGTLPSMLGDLSINFIGPHGDGNSNILQVIDFLEESYVECPVCNLDPDLDPENCTACNNPTHLFFKKPDGHTESFTYGDTIEKHIDGYYLR